MAGGTTKKNQLMPNLKTFDEANDLLMGIVQRQKPGNDLIQNCDLPPPMKVFSNYDNTKFTSNTIGKNIENLTTVNQEENQSGVNQSGVMKALQLSQTRAREAEANRVSIGKELDSLAVAFMEDSMQLFGYRQLLRLLQFQVSQLQKKQEQNIHCGCCDCETKAGDGEGDDDCSGKSNGINWMMALAFCWGVAGIGFAFGFKYHLF